MIDLHTHTTASDGAFPPDVVVARAARGGVRVLSVTDHDTCAAWDAAAAASAAHGIEFVPGIEITAVVDERDVHILGYFVDARAEGFAAFLQSQRSSRTARVRAMVSRLARHGIALDAEAILAPSRHDGQKAPGRPWVAKALVAGGHVGDISEAFDKWLSPGRPGFEPRIGASPREVIAQIHRAGGVASLAHPGPLGHDEWIADMVGAGLDALEVFHRDHDATTTARYLAMARSLKLLMTGGSDFHADSGHGAGGPGSVTLPAEHYERLLVRATARASASGSSTSS